MTPKLYAASLKRINSEGEACPITLDCCKRLLEKVVSKIAQGLSDMDGRRGNCSPHYVQVCEGVGVPFLASLPLASYPIIHYLYILGDSFADKVRPTPPLTSRVFDSKVTYIYKELVPSPNYIFSSPHFLIV